jgi:argininosuccinate lyase
MLGMMAGAILQLGVDAGRCAADVGGDLLATDEVYRRVRDGVPFRTAYRQVAAETKAGAEIPPLDTETILEARAHLGGAGAPALDELDAIAESAAQNVSRRHRGFTEALSRLTGKDDT